LRAQQALNRVDQILQDTAGPSVHAQHINEPKTAPPIGILAQKAANDAAAARYERWRLEKTSYHAS
jgi:hypothetical protein